MIIDTEKLNNKLIGKDIRKIDLETKIEIQLIEELWNKTIRPSMLDANANGEEWRVK